MPRRSRIDVERLYDSQNITTLLQVLNQATPEYHRPRWECFRRERLEDLEWLQHPVGNPPVARDICWQDMGVNVPHPRYLGPFAIDPAAFNHDHAAIETAFACLRAVKELAEAGR